MQQLQIASRLQTAGLSRVPVIVDGLPVRVTKQDSQQSHGIVNVWHKLRDMCRGCTMWSADQFMWAWTKLEREAYLGELYTWYVRSR